MKYTDNFDNAWLGIDKSDLKGMINPLLDNRSDFDIENPHLHVLKLMRNPRYFGWTCKILFNINLLPEQVAILRELWIRPFPMYIASRGFGKSFLLALYAMLKCVLVPGTKVVIVGAAFRQSKIKRRDAPLLLRKRLFGEGGESEAAYGLENDLVKFRKTGGMFDQEFREDSAFAVHA